MYKDLHIHLENRPYTKVALKEFVDKAIAMDISEIGLVEHSHRFEEFKPLYQDMVEVGGEMANWYLSKKQIPIVEYLNFMEEMKKEEWPIKINYGLEICYFPQHEDFIVDQMYSYPFDYYIGSVHHVDNMAFDLKGISEAYLWDVKTPDEIIKKYYELVESMIRFGHFEIIGHLDTIKLFNHQPTYDLVPTYEKLAGLIKDQLMIVENNSGSHYRYHHKDVGISDELLEILMKNDVEICTASDAHKPEDVGKSIKELLNKIGLGYT